MDARTLPTEELARIITGYADALGTYQEEINGLNVYPVPDGDTGTNLRLTLESVRRQLESGDDVTRSIVRGSLMGARGNSGVIISQIFRGLVETIEEAGGLGADSLRRGLRRAADLAYEAVTKPQEGTILTVAREVAEEAEEADEDDLGALAHRIVVRARDALARTPEQLPILRKAGVVDAGGRGLVLFLECLLHTLDGSPLTPPQVPERSPADAVGAEEEDEARAAGPKEGELEFPFEVQFLLEADDEDAAAYRQRLDNYGDCVLVVGGNGTYNVHIHTDQIGPVIEGAIEIGRPRNIEVTHLEGQVASLREHEAAVVARIYGEEPDTTEQPRDQLGLVAVAAGEGILEIFRSLGVKGLVPGGQTFNPSAEEVLAGIREANAEEVIVLPNNRNVISSARTAAELAASDEIVKRVEVLPTESPLQAFTALVNFDPDASLDENLELMGEEGLRTKHAEVAHAVRTTETPAGHVEEGQCLGVFDGDVRVVCDNPKDAVMSVLSQMLADGDSLVTLLYGAGVDEWSAHELGKQISERFEVEVEVHLGDQPHYPYLIGVE